VHIAAAVPLLAHSAGPPQHALHVCAAAAACTARLAPLLHPQALYCGPSMWQMPLQLPRAAPCLLCGRLIIMAGAAHVVAVWQRIETFPWSGGLG
jgi:hypothetical protein